MTNSKDFRQSLQSPMNARLNSSTDTELLFLAAARIRIDDSLVTYVSVSLPRVLGPEWQCKGANSGVKVERVGIHFIFINNQFSLLDSHRWKGC